MPRKQSYTLRFDDLETAVLDNLKVILDMHDRATVLRGLVWSAGLKFSLLTPGDVAYLSHEEPAGRPRKIKQVENGNAKGSRSDKEAMLEELKAKIVQMERDLSAKDAELDVLKSRDEGWLILTPNCMYDGTTSDIKFHNGCAFVRKDAVLPRFVQEVPTQNQIDKFTEREKEAYLEAAKISSAEGAVRILTTDFGYKSQFFSKDQSGDLDAALAARAEERKAFEAKVKPAATAMMERLMRDARL
jgi:hypothetical protein